LKPTSNTWATSGILARLLAAILFAACAGARGAESGAGDADAPVHFVAYGGCEGANATHRALVEQMVKLKPELVIHTGGMLGSSRQGHDWQAFDEATKPLRDLGPFYPCRNPAEGPLHLSGIEFPEPVGKSRPYYSFDHKGLHFISLDSSQRIRRDDPQTKWLACDLGAVPGKMTFVFFYDPVQTVTGRPSRLNPRNPWHELFVRCKVRAVLSGAHHIYYRTAQGGVPYLVTGGGGAPLDEIMARHDLLPSDVAGAFHHFIEFTVKGKEIRGRAVDTEGKTRDEFVLTPPP
jgi:hypothetical protein